MTAPQRPAANSDARKRAEERTAENDALLEALDRVPSCAWHGHGAYPEACWWCALNRVSSAINAPLHCLACGTSQREGMSYLAFIHAHAECEAS